jgi:ubiquinone biosynthesis protein
VRLFRLAKILSIASRFGIDEMILEHEPSGRLAALSRSVHFWRRFDTPSAVRLRLALEALGPIFVKFGQVLSTRRDLLPPDIADELAKLQDRVPPFSSELALAQIEQAYGRPASEVFAEFDATPVASASIAQVHFARLRPEDGGHEVAVKMLRPGMHERHRQRSGAARHPGRSARKGLVGRQAAEAARSRRRVRQVPLRRTRPDARSRQLLAAAAQFRRLAAAAGARSVLGSVHDDGDGHGAHARHPDQSDRGADRRRHRSAGLSRAGVEIFFTQVFRDGFFHADMHPGNIFIATDAAHHGSYIALDFGIVGTLTDNDKNYLAQNFLAFFQRDYKRVATAHIEAGWAPADTRADEFEAAIRAVCEPIFDRPLHEISFGRVSAAPVPDLAPLQRRDPAAAGDAAEDAAQHRRARSPARPQPRSLEDRQALPRTLDERTARPACLSPRRAAGGAKLGAHPAATAASGLPGAGADQRAGSRAAAG